MAYISDTTNTFGSTIADAWTAVTSAIGTFFADIHNAGARSEAIKELQAMDDATLQAKHGITRSQIIGYVFRDKLLP
ncbi:hypothetical protein [Amylibacter sp. IMCC11727]|uniref:hypothetical protein n=1 Tax=Amylibacter sp. IMCC11727 TaxID=3039851 RepID=UPI00244DBEDE|nr:hypothetical protein [Amylibacter sp. IMCC11727]WGI21387.1 hypothetical protein QBD29_14900 [Amylibacter sp. IMCC11727]